MSDLSTAELMVAVGARKHADSLAPRVAHAIGKTAGPLREYRNG